MTRPGLVITCEHGGNHIPGAYRHLFQGQEAVLQSHRGFDPGALEMAETLAEAFGAVLVSSTVSRLLVDLNRSTHNPTLHADAVRRLPAEQRQEILTHFYQPYRAQVEQAIRQTIADCGAVVHLSSHSFTPELNGRLRKADVERASTEAALAFASQAGLPAAAPAATVNVFGVDKFPRMIDYVVPTGVRLGDADRVRLGAYLSSGTTVMHAGFVNFNAGTLGVSMVEGRVSQGVVVGDGSDIGGGASIMGTLSGGGKLRNSIGEHSLLGANAGIGIPLGDRNTVESGLYITAGTKVALLDGDNQLVKVVKARELAGQTDLLFRRNSLNGAVECKTHKSAIELNEALHAHN